MPSSHAGHIASAKLRPSPRARRSASAAVVHSSSFLWLTCLRHSARAIASRLVHASCGRKHSDSAALAQSIFSDRHTAAARIRAGRSPPSSASSDRPSDTPADSSGGAKK